MLARSVRLKMLAFPVNETILGRLLFTVVSNTRKQQIRYFKGVSASKNKDTLEILLDSFFEDTLQKAVNIFNTHNEYLDQQEFLNGFLFLQDWNKNLEYPTIYDIVLDVVEQWQQYHYQIIPGPSKDTWLSLLVEKMKWPKDRVNLNPFLRNNNMRVWLPFKTNEELDSILEVPEKFLQVGKLQLPERIFYEKVNDYESYIDSYASKRSCGSSRRDRYLRSCGRRTIRTWKEMVTIDA